MVRRILVSLCGLLALAVAPWAHAETRGYFEGIIGNPAPNNAATGAVPVTGWAVSTSGIAKVVIQVDGIDVGQASYGRLRPDVTAAQPGFVDSPAPGFAYHLNSTHFTNAHHRITAKVYSFNGDVVVLGQAYDPYFNNNSSILRPFGRIDFPYRNAQLFGTCDINATNAILSPISGWALDLGVEIGDTGIGYVELMVDGSLIFNTRTDCHYSIPTGGLTQCYGLPRQDVEATYPYALNAPAAGFRFVLDVGFLVGALGYTEGAHYLTIRSGDVLTNVENIDEIPVTFLCSENVPDQGSIGEIEQPRSFPALSGTVVFQGWAIDIDGVDHVEMWVDGQFVANADYGIDTRPAVLSFYPGYPDAAAPVWRYFWNSTTLADGVRQLQVYVVDDLGHRHLIGDRSFYVDNDEHTP
jgi:hypothetical protein